MILFIIFLIETNLGASYFLIEGLLMLEFIVAVALKNIIIWRVKVPEYTLVFHEQLIMVLLAKASLKHIRPFKALTQI